MTDDHRHDDLHERLEHLDRRIQALEAELAARRQGGEGPKYYESGHVHPELDDQTIAP
ncbi:MAG: hypothetical protein M3326_11495 [Actinomycetota bacterium]|nr:hypothetical protein [Actinomycetota bacterium]